jgi:hemoglobin
MTKPAPLRLALALLTLALCATMVPVNAADAPPPTKPSLYKRLGGFDAIATVVDDFMGRLVAEPQMARFFAGHSMDSKMKLRQRVLEKVCAATGGPCYYTGRDLKTAHAGLGITEADFALAGKLLAATLDHLKVPAGEKDEVLALVTSWKGEIVEAPTSKP